MRCLLLAWLALSVQSIAGILEGVSTIRVIVSKIPEQLSKDCGLTEDGLRNDIEIRLRRNGIIVASDSGAFPILFVTVGGFKDGQPTWIWSEHVELGEGAQIERKKRDIVLAYTWESKNHGLAGIHRISEAIRESTADLIDEFVNDWLKDNPVEVRKPLTLTRH